MNLVDRYFKLLKKVENIAEKQGRNPREITLVAVSKGRPTEEIRLLAEAGCRDYGESRIQEALPKIEATPSGLHWHFIGPLQKNKVKKVIGRFSLIHSVDSYKLADCISKNSLDSGIRTPILLQVNISGESSKQGFHPEEIRKAFIGLVQLPGVSIQGLMTIAPLTEDNDVIRACFSGLRLLRDELRIQSGLELPHLSMGMSHDYSLAIAEGATLLRVGSEIFSG